MNKYSSARRGKYFPKNPNKWIQPKNITYRSSIEQRFFTFFDLNKNVIKIASEKIIIPYYDSVKKKHRRYYVDLVVKYKDKENKIKTQLIEIKSSKEAIMPKKPKRITENYKHSVLTWVTNQCKWKAAKKFAEQRNWSFAVLTDRDL